MFTFDQVRAYAGFYPYDLQFFYWTLRHPTDLVGTKALLRDHDHELALEKGNGDGSHPDGQVWLRL